MNKKIYQPVIIYFCAGNWKPPLPVGELRYPIYLLSKKCPVLFVEPPITIREMLKGDERIRKYGRRGFLRRLPGANMFIFTPRTLLPYSVRLPLPGKIKSLLLRWNISVVSRQVLRQFRRLFPGKALPDIVWGTIFHHAGFFDKVRGRYNLAIIDDNFPQSPVFTRRQKEQVADMERRLISRSSHIFTTSQTLLEEKRKINPNAVLMENGAPSLFLPENQHRLEPFVKACPLAEREVIRRIDRLPKPRIGYVGAVNIRLWPSMLRALTKLEKRFHSVFVGNIDDSFPGALLESLKTSPKIHFFPYVSHALVPEALKLFDALLLPFQCTRFSDFINPLKVSEYLTSGKPIISTPLPEVMRITSGRDKLVYIVRSPAELEAAVEQALSEQNPAIRRERIDLARSRTWQQTTQEMRAVVEGIVVQ